MEWYLKPWQNFAGFEDRSRRKEYWTWALGNFVIVLVLAILGQVADVFLYVYGVFALAAIVPGLAVTVRRLHDTDRSGWWVLISLVPIVGGIVLLVFTLLEGTHGPNQYGPSPKQHGTEPYMA